MSGGGIASGPVSFMKGFDAFAGVVKSGGKTRRAAKMVILDADHPDVIDFIDSKANEEKKAWALIEQGYDPCFTGEAYGSVFFQNANHSRARDRRVHAGRRAATRTGDPRGHRRPAGRHVQGARHLPQDGRRGLDLCGDPGIQYDTTINDWHTSREHGPDLRVSNPCSEYMFLNDTACNLAQLNLMKFVARRRRVRRRGVPLRRQADDHGAGDPGRQRQLPDAADRGELATASARSAWATPTSAPC